MGRLRLILALGMGLSAAGAFALPAAAETILVACSGTCGYYEVTDQGPSGPTGANCTYETASQELDSISVRPPSMHGNYSFNTRVEWRFKIRHAADYYTGGRSTIFTSTWQSAMANESTPAYAGHGFSRRTWWASENPNGYYFVWLELRWQHGGSVEGTAKLKYDWYKLVNTGFGNYVSGDPYCYEVA